MNMKCTILVFLQLLFETLHTEILRVTFSIFAEIHISVQPASSLRLSDFIQN
jgi:hypothetical protein